MWWTVGFVFALVVALIAYPYYEVSVLLGMSIIGFALGTSALVAIGVSWSWAIVLVGGLMLLVGKLQTEQITESGSLTDQIHDDWWWSAIWVGLTVAGIVAQFAATDRLRGTMREAWAASGGSAPAAT